MKLDIDPNNPPTILTMGVGSVVIAHGIHDGMPFLYLCPAKKPGMMGAPADSEVDDQKIPENAVIIRFATMEAVINHIGRVERMVEAMEAVKHA